MTDTTVITADPPSKWNDELPGEGRGATAHMLPLSLEDIQRTELPRITTESAILFLWRPAGRLGDALEVCKAWGFEPKTEMVWCKETKHGKRAFGMGRLVRGEHETCVLATRGTPHPAVRSVRSTFTAYAAPYTKPVEFYDIVREMFPGAIWYDRTAQNWHSGWHMLQSGRQRSGDNARVSVRAPARTKTGM